MRWKKIMKPAAFFLGLLILLTGMSLFFMPKGIFDGDSNMILIGVANEPENTLDYVSIGDSESWTSLSPMEIWKEYGYAGYNGGVALQRLQDTYYLLQRILIHQAPKVVFLETNAFYAAAENSRKEFQKMEESFLYTLFPVFQYHNRWKTIDFGTVKNLFSASKRALNPLKGYRLISDINAYTKGNYIKKTSNVDPIPDAPLFYLNKITELCAKKKIRLVLFSVPSPMCWSYERHNAIAAYAKQNHIDYLDLNLKLKDLGIDWTKDSCDKGDHMNYYGAEKISLYLGRYLRDICEMTGHRGDNRYVSWESALNEYGKIVEKKICMPKSITGFHMQIE